MKKKVQFPALKTWNDLNEFLATADEETCEKLLEVELKDRQRPSFAFRIHSRLNRLRAARERKEMSYLKTKK